MSRNTVAKINLAAIKHNYLYAKSCVPYAQAVAIVKANAYGHGSAEVAKYLDDTVDLFGVACIEEALEIRQAGVKSPILLLEGVFEFDEIEVANNNNFFICVTSEEGLEWILSVSPQEPLTLFLKYDSGMGRLGFQDDTLLDAFEKLSSSNNIKEIVLMTHFACADEVTSLVTDKQMHKIDSFYKSLKYYNNKTKLSISNSAGVLTKVCQSQDFIRPGIMLYGASPVDTNQHDIHLLTAMTVTAPIISIKKYTEGDSIGYGGTFICPKDMTVGVVAFGYGDGYPRHAITGTPVYLNGLITHIVGRVSMDMLTIDLTHIPNININDRVELFGENVSINDVARCADTISYEIYTKITKRVYREYLY
jgi:alanine racemase